ncbi:MAG: glycosyltransferase [Chloroflexi bacterium]|nr:glycosyltransferase [Chloroflexota bacterium]
MRDAAEPGRGHRPRLLLYAMYDATRLDAAPRVRIALLGAALEQVADVEHLQGGRAGRMIAGVRWWARGGFGRVEAIYVETSTVVASPFDLVFLAWSRLRRRPVGIYFRDAYQLHRDLFPIQRRRQLLADVAWRATLPILRRVATTRFAPSAGLADVLGLRDAVLLPPGTDPSLPDLGVSRSNLIAAVVAPTRAAGFDILRAALELVRREVPDARLRVITSAPAPKGLPEWIEVAAGDRSMLATLLGEARLIVIPVPLTRYGQLAVPVRLADLVAFGKPIVATDSAATRAFLRESEAALLSDDTAEALASTIGRVLRDDVLAAAAAARARAFAEAPGSTWRNRAETVIEHLVGHAA